jgi:pimeloyl-ACP methyl ester carboxylesterase
MIASTPTQSSVATSADRTTIGYETVGRGDAVLVVGGAWRAADDYLALARALASSFTVHVVDRRGRGRSGPQGPAYSIEREVEDLLAVRAQTEASVVFGHSFGGLVALETARRSTAFTDVIAYEPGVSIGGSIPVSWMAPYRDRLVAGDRRGAFATMVHGAGAAPPVIERLPLWYLKLVLRAVIRGSEWRRTDSLLEASLAEHGQVAAVDDGSADRFRAVAARTLLLGGGKSRPRYTTALFDQLVAAIPNATAELLPGLDHLGPEKAPEAVAERVREQITARAFLDISCD